VLVVRVALAVAVAVPGHRVASVAAAGQAHPVAAAALVPVWGLVKPFVVHSGA
jgi:hypothetical protein